MALKPRGKPFAKGNSGRPAGIPNKLTKTVKETVLEVFNQIQEDPEINLAAFAKNYPKDFYTVASKLIPTELTAKIDNNINLHIVRGKSNTQRSASGPVDGNTGSEEV